MIYKYFYGQGERERQFMSEIKIKVIHHTRQRYFTVASPKQKALDSSMVSLLCWCERQPTGLTLPIVPS